MIHIKIVLSIFSRIIYITVDSDSRIRITEQYSDVEHLFSKESNVHRC